MLGIAISCVKISLLLMGSGWLITSYVSEPDKTWIRRKALWLMPLIYAGAMTAPNVWVIMLFVAVLIPIIARNRGEASFLAPFVFLGIPLMSYEIRLGGSAMGTLDTWRCVFFGALLAAAAYPRRHTIRMQSSTIIPFILYYIVSIVISIHGANITTSLRSLIELTLTFVVPLFLMFAACKDVKVLSSFALALTVAISLQAIIAVFQSLSYWPIYENIFWATGIPLPKTLAAKVRGGLMRATGSYLESTSFSMLFALGFTLALGLRDRFVSQLGYRLMCGLMLVGIYATVSRGGFVFAICAWLAFEAYLGRWGKVFGAAFVVVGAYVGATLGASVFPSLGAFTGANADSAGTAEYRRQLFQRSMEEIAKNPLFGQSQASVNVSMADLRQGEGIIDFVNGYMLAGVFGGVGAMIALLAVFVISATQLYRVRNRIADREIRLIAASCFGIHIAYMVVAFTSGFFGPTTIPYVMVMGLTAIIVSAATSRAPSVRTNVTGVIAPSEKVGAPLRAG